MGQPTLVSQPTIWHTQANSQCADTQTWPSITWQFIIVSYRACWQFIEPLATCIKKHGLDSNCSAPMQLVTRMKKHRHVGKHCAEQVLQCVTKGEIQIAVCNYRQSLCMQTHKHVGQLIVQIIVLFKLPGPPLQSIVLAAPRQGVMVEPQPLFVARGK